MAHPRQPLAKFAEFAVDKKADSPNPPNSPLIKSRLAKSAQFAVDKKTFCCLLKKNLIFFAGIKKYCNFAANNMIVLLASDY